MSRAREYRAGRLVGLIGLVGMLLAAPSGARGAAPSDAAMRALAPVAELLVITAPFCPACDRQAALAEAVARRYQYRIRTVSAPALGDPAAARDPVLGLAAARRADWADKLPVIYVAVPGISALLPVVSARSLPRTEEDLLERLGIIADLAAGSP